MGLKHKKYAYVKRGDGVYVKVRILNVRFGSKVEQGDISDPSRYIITGFKTYKPPKTAVIISEDTLPDKVRETLYII